MTTISISQDEAEKLFDVADMPSSEKSPENIKKAINKIINTDITTVRIEFLFERLEKRYKSLIIDLQEFTEKIEEEKHRILNLKEKLKKYEGIIELEEMIYKSIDNELSEDDKKKLFLKIDELREKLNIRVGIRDLEKLFKERRRGERWIR